METMPMDRYECDQCGACCRGSLLVEVYDLDVQREPRLASADVSRANLASVEAVMADLNVDADRCLIIAGGKDRPCCFLGDDNRCTIYPTRPNVCVAMAAGSDQCQLAREAIGLPLLQSATSTGTCKDSSATS